MKALIHYIFSRNCPFEVSITPLWPTPGIKELELSLSKGKQFNFFDQKCWWWRLHVHMLRISQEGCQTQWKLLTTLPISSSRPYEAGEQYHYQIMCTVRLITMDYTSFKPLIVQVRSVIYQMSIISFHCNV